MKKKYNVVELFAGCGGLSEGFHSAEIYDVLAYVEWEEKPCKTLTHRLEKKWNISDAKRRVIRFDMQRTEELIKGWKDDPIYNSGEGLNNVIGDKKVDIISGGPPCQAYSIAGRVRDKDGMHYDYRNYLFESYLKIVNYYRPKLFIFENVPGILSANPGGVNIIDRITRDFQSIGYDITKNIRNLALINANDYGVPQIRNRVILVGLNNEVFNNNESTLTTFYNDILKKYRKNYPNTVNDAIKDYPKIYPYGSIHYSNGKKQSHYCESLEFLNHIPRFHNERDQKIFRELAIDFKNGRQKFPNAQSLIDFYKELTGFTSNFHKYHVLVGDKPSTAIPAHLFKDGLRHIHPDPEQSRSITVREAAKLQGFDDDFEFIGGMGDQYKMIGNAVPPPLSRALAFSIRDLLTRKKE